MSKSIQNEIGRLNEVIVQQYQQGRYEQAVPLAIQACDLTRQQLGEQHPDYATSLNNLAVLYQAMGNYAAAEPLYRQARDIRRTALGEQHSDYATSLNTLAMLYQAMGNYAAAEPLYRQASEIARKALGADHPGYATDLNNLAMLYYSMGNYAAAQPLLRQASDITRTALGDQHPDYATSLNNLALLYQAMGNYTAAEPLFRQASEILRIVLGETHPDYAQSLNNLARLCARINREDEALALARQASTIHDRLIGQVFSIGSERQRMAYLSILSGEHDSFLSLVSRVVPHDDRTAVCAALDLVLRRKAIGAEALAAQRDAVLGGRYPNLAPKLRDLTTLRAQIARATLDGPGKEEPAAYQQRLAGWVADQERREADLARQIPEMNLAQQLRIADRSAVAAKLPTGTALIEFVRFDVFDFTAVPARGEPQWQPARYLAFVLPAGTPDDVAMIDLGAAERIEQLIAAFRASIAGGERNLRPVPAPPTTNSHAGVALRAAVFDPLIPALGGRAQLFLAPDGDLSHLPFEVLPTADERRLIDTYQISYLGVGRDVLRFGATTTGTPGAPLVAADPNFDLSTTDTASPAHDTGAAPRRSRDLDRSGLTFPPLSHTHAEGLQIADLLGVAPLLGDAVLEYPIKRCGSPRILHLATHGYFLPNQPAAPHDNRPGFLAGVGGASGPERFLGAGAENPLLRSGLALAGANTRLRGGALPKAAGDGLINAEDVTGLDLLDTELVVLSACETGLGQVQVGEGVFGLRRAFVLAGARTLVMSLWQVPDRQTQELMEDFYHRILAGQPRAAALRAAQLEMKARYPAPYYWGAFICQGEPGPLL